MVDNNVPLQPSIPSLPSRGANRNRRSPKKPTSDCLQKDNEENRQYLGLAIPEGDLSYVSKPQRICPGTRLMTLENADS